jgi:exonuclease SbcC
MRPLELRLRNFRSYFGESPPFDFRGRSLVGIVGPIGSGKSSLLDAVSFALYGKTPAGGAGTKALIHQRAGDGGVQLRFEVDGDVWEVVRSLRQRGQSQHALYRYETDEDGAEPVEKVTLESEVNERIAALLGLDFDAFGRSVLLAQGRFAEFLKARPAERDAVLKGVFGHDRINAMRDIAKDRAASAAAELKAVLVRTEQLDRVAERLARSREALAAAEERVERLRKAEPQIADLDGRITAAAADVAEGSARLDELSRHAARLPDPDATTALLEGASSVARRRAELAAALEAAVAAAAMAEEELAAMRTAGDLDTIEQAARLLAASEPQRRNAADAARREEAIVRRRTDAAAQVAAATSAVIEAEKALAAAEARLGAAERSLQAAERAHHDAEHQNMADVLRRDLTKGATCPVCAQTVAELPASAGRTDVSATADALARAKHERSTAEAVRTAAAAGASAARESADATAALLATVEGEAAQAGLARTESEEELQVTIAQLTALLGDGEAAQLLDDRRRRVVALTDAATDARRKVEQVRARHDQAILDEQAAGKELSALRVGLVELATRLGQTVADIEESPEPLAEATIALRAAWSDTVAALEAGVVESRAAGEAADSERRELLAELGITGDFVAALATEEAGVAHLAVDVAAAQEEIAAADELLETRDRLEAEKARFDRIASDLTDSRFVRFLLDEERARLADLGSDHFQRLSSGRYRFTEDGSFSIVDLTAADAVRKASSLSGGETFLASLALALSLAEMVTRTGGRLDAFFLDEGFGSLDPEHLDLAMEGIEALVADDASRLVVVVSHVPELRHRIEDLIQLDRDPSTGDTRVLRS